MTLELQKLSPGQNWAYNLTCHIIRVEPCLSLVVTFFKGSQRLGTPSFTNCTWVEIENYTVTLPVTLHPEDHGQEAYCHAAVRLGLHEPVYQTKSSEVSLKTAGKFASQEPLLKRHVRPLSHCSNSFHSLGMINPCASPLPLLL